MKIQKLALTAQKIEIYVLLAYDMNGLSKRYWPLVLSAFEADNHESFRHKTIVCIIGFEKWMYAFAVSFICHLIQ